jgi:hypothetical protein
MQNFSTFIKIQIAVALIFFTTSAFSQTLFYSDQFHGGITCGGYSPDYSSGGTGTFSVHIEPASSIHKAYLLAGRHGNAMDLTVTLNGTSLTLNSSNQASITFQSPLYGGNSGVHAIDVTDIIDSSVSNYTLVVPFQNGPNDRYNDFYLFIAYENSSLPNVNAAIYLNENDLTDAVTWTLDLPFAWNTAYDAAVSLFTGYSCYDTDGEFVSVDGTYLGEYYGPEPNSGSCGGPLGNFYYQNGILTGSGGDDEDQAMNGPDVISNASGIVSNGGTSSSILFDSQSGSFDNAIWAVVVANGGGCPAATLSPNDTTVCYGFGIQLNATGGSEFTWSPGAGLSDSTIANPIATPDSTTLYVVTISDTAGCSSTDSILITVLPHGVAGPDVSVCKGDSAQLSASGGLSYSWSPTIWLSNPLIPDPICNAQTTTTYTVTITNPNDCVTTDELTVNVVPTVLPPTITQNGNLLTCSPEVSYQWKLNSVDIPGATNQTYTILIGGLYSCAVITDTGCPTESDPFNANPIGVDEATSLQGHLKISPNPFSDFVSLTSPFKTSSVLSVMNSQGQIIFTRKVEPLEKISLFGNEFPEGNLILFRLISDEGILQTGIAIHIF